MDREETLHRFGKLEPLGGNSGHIHAVRLDVDFRSHRGIRRSRSVADNALKIAVRNNALPATNENVHFRFIHRKPSAHDGDMSASSERSNRGGNAVDTRIILDLNKIHMAGAQGL